jgi:hypothetical protein
MLGAGGGWWRTGPAGPPGTRPGELLGWLRCSPMTLVTASSTSPSRSDRGNCGRLSRSETRPCSAAHTRERQPERVPGCGGGSGGLAGLDGSHQDLKRPPPRGVTGVGRQAGRQIQVEHHLVVHRVLQGEVAVGPAARQQRLARVADPAGCGCRDGGQVGERLIWTPCATLAPEDPARSVAHCGPAVAAWPGPGAGLAGCGRPCREAWRQGEDNR